MSTTPRAAPPNVTVGPEPRREALAYAVAVAILVVGGAIVRTPILNWICGPAIVVACVGFFGPKFVREPGADPAATDEADAAGRQEPRDHT